LSLQPAASALSDRGTVTRLEIDPLRRALSHKLVPLVFGDVAFDEGIGGTILSTEDVFVHLARVLKPSWILLFGNAPGVLGRSGAPNQARRTIPLITPASYPSIEKELGGSGYTDVTGGMADKVKRMIDLVKEQPNLRVRILSGQKPGNFRDALRDPAHHASGTLICSDTYEPQTALPDETQRG
jgi:isopentenyl phosphate kinase